MEHQISVSPAISDKFKIKKSEIVCLATDSVFKPLATSNNRMDGEQVCRHRVATLYKKIA